MARRRTLITVALLMALAAPIAAQQSRALEILQQIRQLLDQQQQLGPLLDELTKILQPPLPPPPVVQPGQNVSAAIAAAPVDGVVELVSGATYTESIRIARGRVTVRTRKAQPTDAPAIVQGVGASPVVDVTGSDVRLEGITWRGTATTNTVVLVGHADATQTTLAQVPQRVTVTGCTVEGVVGTKNAMELHAADATVTGNRIIAPGRVGQETHGIIGWNGPGPFLIADNEIEAASIGVMFGGAVPTIPWLVPADIQILRNRISKRIEWRGQGRVGKNHVEFKAARRVRVAGNRLTTSWAGEGQSGYSVLLTPAWPASGGNPDLTLDDITIEDNEITDVGAGFQIQGKGQNDITGQTARVVIRRNWVQTTRATMGGQGWIAIVTGGPRDVTFDGNTLQPLGVTQFIEAPDVPALGFRFVGNLVAPVGQYGLRVYAGGTMQNNATRWSEHFPGGVITGNAFIGGTSVLRANLPENLHLPECLERDPATNACTRAAASLIVNGIGTDQLAPYGRAR